MGYPLQYMLNSYGVAPLRFCSISGLWMSQTLHASSVMYSVYATLVLADAVFLGLSFVSKHWRRRKFLWTLATHFAHTL